MYFYLLVAVQIFCAYHVYKNQKPYYWFLLIFFVPLIGCIAYIITHMYTKTDADKLQKDIVKAVYPTIIIKDLENKLQFSESYTNRINLADAYFEIKDYSNAIKNYQFTLSDTVQDQYYARAQLVRAYFELQDFDKVTTHAEAIRNDSRFNGSTSQFYYGLALQALGQITAAEQQLKPIDRPYSNYKERLELAKFYLAHHNKNAAMTILNDISVEAQYMTKPNRRLYKSTITEVERLLKTQ